MKCHKLNMVFTILLLFIGFNTTRSQSKLQIGFDIRDEYIREVYTALFKSEYNNNHEEYFCELPAVDFLALYNMSKNYSLELNVGYDLLNVIIPRGQIIGPSGGFSVRRKIFNYCLYGKFSFNLLFNRGSGVLPMLGLGVDIYTSENISFNLMLVKLLKEKIADYTPGKGYPEKVFGEIRYPYLMKFGFSFYWDIL